MKRLFKELKILSLLVLLATLINLGLFGMN
ncbi:hypothetical protein BAMA111019_15380 [Bacillus manliponensis]